MEAILARLLGRPALTRALGCTHALASPGTLVMGKPARSSTTVPEGEEERTPAPAMLSALQPALEPTVVLATPITLEME